MLQFFGPIILLIFQLFGRCTPKSQFTRCFQRIVRRSIDNSQPIVELFYVTPYQCIDHCIYVTNNNAPRAKLCHSFVYDYLQHSCRLYDHDGKQPPAILHPAENLDYFKRTAILGQCAGPGSPNSPIIFKPSANDTTKYSLKMTSTGTTSPQSMHFLKNSGSIFLPAQNLPSSFAHPTPANPSVIYNEISETDTVSMMDNRQPETEKNQNSLPQFASSLPQPIGSSLSYQKTDTDTNQQPFPYKLNFSPMSQLPETIDIPVSYQIFHRNRTVMPTSFDAQIPVFVSASSKEGSTDYKIENVESAQEHSLSTKKAVPPYLVSTASPVYEDLFKNIGNNQRTTLAIPSESKFDEETGNSPDTLDAIYDQIAQLPEVFVVPTQMPENVARTTTLATERDAKQSAEQTERTSDPTTDSFPTPAVLLVATTQAASIQPGSSNNEMATQGKRCARTAYYVVIGYEIVLPISAEESSVRLLQNVKQSECARYCSENIGPKNEPLNCSSMNYFPLLQKCEIYSTLAEPHGSGNLLENDESIYGEKFCLAAPHTACQQDEIFILHVQKKIKSAAIDMKTSRSITGCLSYCLDKADCKSAGFDSERHRCHLYDVDVGESPNLVISADAGWVLIENGCRNVRRRPTSHNNHPDVNALSSDAIQWGEWSPCQFKQYGRAVRVRARKCELNCPDGGLQVEFC